MHKTLYAFAAIGFLGAATLAKVGLGVRAIDLRPF